jgi:TrmH family RNA methyltransferase
MPQHIGAHHERIAFTRALLTKKGRTEGGAFSFEGATLLDEALNSGTPIHAVYATERAYEATPRLRELESGNITVYLVDERTFAKISDLETPSGILAVAGLRFSSLAEILGRPGITLVLADINDPGNAGALVRSAEAFGASGVVFGNLGVEPYHPKVVRSAMGTIFRLPLAVAEPETLGSVAESAGASLLGLTAGGKPIGEIALQPANKNRGTSALLIVGHERHGLGRWAAVCTMLVGVPMKGPTESLNAAVAGSIALYELMKR